MAVRSLTLRVLLVPLLVFTCYQFEWLSLRRLTTAAVFRLSQSIGVPMMLVGPDLVVVNGILVQFVVACTLIDAMCGAIPLLWKTSSTVTSNIMRLLTIFPAMFVFNIFRLEIGFFALARGTPWWLAHEVVSGITYFALLVFVVKQRAWSEPRALIDPRVGRAHPPTVRAHVQEHQ